MPAVSNTSPLNYLIQIGQVELFQRLYGRIAVPDAVIRELQHTKSPEAVRNWAARIPEWVEVRTPAEKPDIAITHLGSGELAAILLAQEIGADVLVIDERAGYIEAQNRGLQVTGTLGVLDKAANLGLIDFKETMMRLLTATNFRIRRETAEMLLNSHGPR
ncbi:MAG: DUF3368 domain-containing protein [Candidatus Acidiferrales bacterium]